MAWLALVRADLLALSRSWVVRGWVLVLALWDFVTLVPKAGQPAPPAASELLSMHLGSYLFVWSTVIILLSAGSFSHEADIVADGILSRACTRTQYIAAKLAARVLVIVGIYALFSGIAGTCAWRYAAGDMSALSAATGIAVVGLALLLLITLGVTLSVVLNNTLFAAIGLLMLWYVAAPVFSFLGAEYLSPASLVRNLPRMLKDSKAPEVVLCTATTTSLTVAFSKDVDAAQAETVDNYAVKCAKRTRTAKTAAYDKSRTRVILSGLTLPKGKEVKVTVSGVTDAAGNEISPAANLATATVIAAPGAAEVVEEDSQPVVQEVAPGVGPALPGGWLMCRLGGFAFLRLAGDVPRQRTARAGQHSHDHWNHGGTSDRFYSPRAAMNRPHGAKGIHRARKDKTGLAFAGPACVAQVVAMRSRPAGRARWESG